MCFWIHPFLLLLFPVYTQANFYYTPILEKAYIDILELKIQPAMTAIEAEYARDPQNGIAVYLKSLAITTELFLSEDTKQYQLLKSKEAEFLKLISSNNKKNNPYYKFTLAEIRLQWAFVKIKFGDEMGAALDSKQSLSLLNENLKTFPTFIPTRKSLGLLNIVMGSIPPSYAWITSTLGFTGNVNVGISMLKEVQASGTIFEQEAGIMLVVSDQYVLNRNENSTAMKALYEKYRGNLLYTYLYAAVLSKHSRSEEALEIIRNKPQGKEYILFPTMDYLQADLLLQNGHYAESRIYFNLFLQAFKGKNLIKDSYYKVFLSYWLNNEDEAAMPYWNGITKVGQAVYESDKYAQKIASNNELPNKNLTRIRLLTDGGLYNKAFEVLRNTYVNDLPSKKDKIEFYYRSARLYHKSGNVSEAIDYYKKVITLTTTENYYFAPNSALHLGYIYTPQNKTTAIAYFNMAIAYKGHEYENSIEQKAKAALQELK